MGKGVDMAGFNERLGAKQTSYNVAGTVLNALSTAGLLESKEQALEEFENLAASIYGELESTITAAASSGGAPTRQADDTPPGEIEFNFGKHKGSTIADVYESDADYIDWLVNKDWNKARNFMRGKAAAYLETVKAGV